MIFQAGLFVIFLTVGSSYGQTFDCPADPDNITPCLDYKYAYEFNCAQYWQCTTTCTAYLLDCPSGLHFDPDSQICAYPDDVLCQITTTTAGTTPTTTTTGSTASSTAATTTTASTTTPPVFVNPVIVFAGRTSNVPAADDSILFQDEVVDRRSNFDGQYFTVPADGIYFINLNAGFVNSEPGNFRLIGTDESGNDYFPISVRRDSDIHNNMDSSSRDYILSLTAGHRFRMTQSGAIGDEGELYSTAAGLETSWGFFSLQDSLEHISVFSVARDLSYDVAGLIDMNDLATNVGNDWDSATNRYTVPLTGTYYFSFSAGLDIATGARVALRVDGTIVAELQRNHVNFDGLDTFSRGILINLVAGQAVEYHLISGTLWSNSRKIISLSGFYVKPYYTPSAAWSVHRTSNNGGATNLNPVPYQDVLVDEGNVYSSDGTVTIPYEGFYYIHLSAGVPSQSQTYLRLWKNGSEELFRLRRYSTTHRGFDTISRSGIFFLNTGDRLTVQAPNGYPFNSGTSSQRFTSFQGFLIYSTA